MIVHLYAQCWNEESMLPFFFRHYDSIVARYFICDDGSTDGTWSLLQSHPRVAARRFEHAAADSFVLSQQTFSNEAWKESRGEADWIIVTDVDELLFHPRGLDYLSGCTAAGVTLIPSLGFQMISDRLPDLDQNLCLDHPYGAPWRQMMKPSIFDPDEIDEINFSPGRHTGNPTGRVRVPRTDEMLLLHYKYMGLERTHERHQNLRARLGRRDLESGWGHKYLWSKEELARDWRLVAENAIDTRLVRVEPARHYPIPVWWAKYRD